MRETPERYAHLLPPSGISKKDLREWKIRRERITNLGQSLRMLIIMAGAIFAVIWGLREGISQRGDYRIYLIAIAAGFAFAIPGFFLSDMLETHLQRRLHREMTLRVTR